VPAPVIPEARRGVAAGAWLALSGDAVQRALAAWHLGWQPALKASGDDWQAPYLGQLALDPYAAVRMVAARSLEGVDPHGADREAQVAALRAAWDAAPRDPRPAALIGPDGALDEARFQALLADRDHSPILIQE